MASCTPKGCIFHLPPHTASLKFRPGARQLILNLFWGRWDPAEKKRSPGVQKTLCLESAAVSLRDEASPGEGQEPGAQKTHVLFSKDLTPGGYPQTSPQASFHADFLLLKRENLHFLRVSLQ